MLEDEKPKREVFSGMDYSGRQFMLLVASFSLVALYSARVVFEPIAFMLFALALVWPFQTALEARMPRPAALTLTILLTLVVISLPPTRTELHARQNVFYSCASFIRRERSATRAQLKTLPR